MHSFVDILRPASSRLSTLFDILAILAGSCFIALSAQIAIPLWFTPVPMSLQPLAILLIGAILGSRKGALSVIAYITEGILGLPVFAGGLSGIAYFIGPTGGYLIGFILTAFFTGYLLERGWKNHLLSTFAALFLSCSLTLIAGAAYLAFFVGPIRALWLGILPFLIGDLIKVVIATTLIRGGWRIYNQE